MVAKARRGIRLHDGDVVTQLPGAQNTAVEDVRSILLSDIVIDRTLQMRVNGSDADHVSSIVEAMSAGRRIPPIDVYFEPPDVFYLADGFHRVDAVLALGREDGTITARVHRGGYLDAFRHACGANASHGLKRTRKDLETAYKQAVEWEILEPDNVAQVAEILACSERWARELTKKAREQIELERDKRILGLISGGMTQRQVAENLGVSKSTVADVVARKRKSSESGQADQQSPEESDLARKRKSSESGQDDSNAANLAFQAPNPETFDLEKSPPDPQPGPRAQASTPLSLRESAQAAADSTPNSPALQAVKDAFLALDLNDKGRFCQWLQQGGT